MREMKKKYGMGLALNSMEGREVKHISIARYSHNSTYRNIYPFCGWGKEATILTNPHLCQCIISQNVPLNMQIIAIAEWKQLHKCPNAHFANINWGMLYLTKLNKHHSCIGWLNTIHVKLLKQLQKLFLFMMPNTGETLQEIVVFHLIC